MTKAEAMMLANQLGLTATSGAHLEKQIRILGLVLGVDHATGDWVVWDENDVELARCS